MVSYGLLLISQLPLKSPLIFGPLLAALSVLAFGIYGLCRLFREWNPQTLRLWERLYLTSQILFMGISSIMSTWVLKEEGVFSLPGVVAMVMVFASLVHVFNIFFPRTLHQYFAGFVVLGPVMAGIFLGLQADGLTKWALAGVLLVFTFSMSLKASLWRREFVELLRLKQFQEGESFLMQKLLDSIPAKISWFDKDFRYKMTNKSLTQYLGLAPRALIGKEFGLRHDPEFKLLNRKLNGFRASNQRESYFEHPVRVGQELRRHHVILKKIKTAEGIEVLMITLDIEDLKKAQEILGRKETG